MHDVCYWGHIVGVRVEGRPAHSNNPWYGSATYSTGGRGGAVALTNDTIPLACPACVVSDGGGAVPTTIGGLMVGGSGAAAEIAAHGATQAARCFPSDKTCDQRDSNSQPPDPARPAC